jgi:hypothetical protein
MSKLLAGFRNCEMDCGFANAKYVLDGCTIWVWVCKSTGPRPLLRLGNASVAGSPAANSIYERGLNVGGSDLEHMSRSSHFW